MLNFIRKRLSVLAIWRSARNALSFLFVATSARISLPCSLAHSAADSQKGGTIANAGADRQRQQIEPARQMPFLGKACIFAHYGRGIRWHTRLHHLAGTDTRRQFPHTNRK